LLQKGDIGTPKPAERSNNSEGKPQVKATLEVSVKIRSQRTDKRQKK
jgi:hypothetical protein